MSFAHAAALAESLAKVMDDAERQGADLTKLEELAPMSLAAHWQNVARFLVLIRDEWPALLAAEHAINPAARRNLALAALAERLEKHPPSGLVIAAGSTGSIPATARLLALIARLPNGALILPGLDRGLDEQSWRNLDPGHPQFGLKQLLDAAGETRASVKDWHGVSANPAREQLLSESLRPAPTTDHWRALADRGGGEIAEGLKGLQRIEAADPAEEALVIALALRETLEHDGRTAALVTPDRDLGRRVAAELSRWEIAIDDSAGRPLAHTSAGAFLCLLAEAAANAFAPVPLLALLKHPFATLGDDLAHFRAMARTLDRLALRGPRPDPGLDGIARRIRQVHGDPRRKKHHEDCARLLSWWAKVSAVLAPLEQVFANPDAPFSELIVTHLEAAERLSCREARDCPTWRDEDGEAAALFFAAFREGAEGLPPLDPRAYPGLLRTLMMKAPVRPRFSRHRAIAILGPLEARLQSFDLIILGGLNEGSWPGTAAADPWFSRPMRETLGLEQPERTIGLAAHDFSMLAAGTNVLLTRAAKVEGAPTIASRWLQRMTQLTAGLDLKIAEGPFLRDARRLSHVQSLEQARPPAPRPPVAARPRKLSVTEIETWLRDPYAIYAKHVLELEPWESLDAPIGPLERGLALHKALELYKKRFPAPPDDAVVQLMAIADKIFEELAIPKAMLAVWRPRFECAARWFAGFERERAGDIAQSALETRGERKLTAPGGEFTLRGVADRIDILQNGHAAILDYKSGKPPTNAQVKRLLTPQLPLEGAILKAAGFPGLGSRDSDALLYLHISGRGEGGAAQPVDDNVPELIEQAWAKLTARVEHFDNQATPYLSRLQPFSVDSEGDYDHLARVRAWAILEREEE